MSKYEAAVFCVVLTLATLSPCSVYAQERNQIAGQVVDKDNRPVPGVSVKISRGAETLDKQRTDKNGQYVLKFLPGGPISTVLYECMDCHPCAIFNVSGSKDHNITKVVSKKGSQLSLNDYSEIRATLEYLANSSDIPQSERERYADLNRTLPIPVVTPFAASSPPMLLDGDVFVGVLLNHLTTKEARKGDLFAVRVLKPEKYKNAIIGGHVRSVQQRKNKSSITVSFNSITMQDGQSYRFGGMVDEIKLPEEDVTSNDNASTASVKRNALKVSTRSAVVGALFGSLLGGLNDVSIGGGIGASAGTTTEIATDESELNLTAGAELVISVERRHIRQPPEAVAAHPGTDANDSLAKARELYTAEQDEEALKALRDVMSADRANAEAYLLAGRIYLRRGEIEAAINQLRVAIFWDTKRRLIDAHILLGRIFLERGDLAQARTYVHNAIQIDPNNQEAIALQRQIEAGVK